MAPLNAVNDENPRQIAARLLGRRRAGGPFVEDLLEAELAKIPLASADRGLCQELTYGVVRWQAALDWLIARKTGGRDQPPALQNLLRLGLYQIFWLDRIPGHAAVHETVELAKRGGFGPQAGFVNAVLRGYLRELGPSRKLLTELKRSQPALGWSHPEWLVTRWQKRWDAERTGRLLEWNNTPPKTFARVNTLKTTAGRLVEKWRDEAVEGEPVRRDWLGEHSAFELKSHPPLHSLASFRDGWFYLQDPSTLLAVRELDPQPGETVLDLCAAPGGKTTFIAQLVRNQGKIIASDVSGDRLKLIQENCVRLGVSCVEAQVNEIFHPHPDSLPQEREPRRAASAFAPAAMTNPASGFADARKQIPPLPGGEGGLKQISCPTFFDRILVDAPCSNTGVMRRRVDLRWRISREEISRLQNTQLELLTAAATKLKPGGKLVYSTCSLEPEENSEVVQDFLRAQPTFTLESERELLPFADHVDGAYVAALVKGR